MKNKLIQILRNIFSPDKKEKLYLGGGLLGIGEKRTDWVLGNGAMLKDRIKDIKNFNRQPKYEYNQGAQYETRNYCTIYSAITELSFLFDYQFTLCQIEEIGERMIKDKKLDVNKGAYLSDAIDYTRRWWNENFPEQLVESYKFNYLNKTIWKANHFIGLTQLGYRTSPELHNELEKHGFAMKKDYPKNGGHAVSTYGINIIDNYKGKKVYNRYSFHYMEDLIKNGVIYETGYIFIKK